MGRVRQDSTITTHLQLTIPPPPQGRQNPPKSRPTRSLCQPRQTASPQSKDSKKPSGTKYQTPSPTSGKKRDNNRGIILHLWEAHRTPNKLDAAETLHN